VGLPEELDRTAAAAAAHADDGEMLVGVIPTETVDGERIYLCSFERDGSHSWIALDIDAAPVERETLVREAASIAALCEVAEETAGGGDLEELRATLVTLRLTEAPEGIEEAEEAALELERVIGVPPRVASAAFLDAVGAAAQRLEQTLGETGTSPFASAMQQAVGVADELAADVVTHYKVALV
jgi:hypothetical protein